MRSALVSFLAVVLSLPAATATVQQCDPNGTLATNDGTVNSGEYPAISTGLGSGFGGTLGTATLQWDSDTFGALAFALVTPGSSQCALAPTDAVVIYLDSRAGGFTSTAGFTDNSDSGRSAASGVGQSSGRADLTFAAGFTADFAIVLKGSFAGVFELRAGQPHVFVKLLTRTPDATFDAACTRELSGLSVTELGAGLGTDIRYVATLLNASNAFRSNEFHGTAAVPGANIGVASHALAAGDFNVFRPGPESLGSTVRMTFDQYDGSGFVPLGFATCGQHDSNLWAATGWSDGALAFGGVRITANTDYTRGFSAAAVTAGGPGGATSRRAP
jgi:hypothetical protein